MKKIFNKLNFLKFTLGASLVIAWASCMPKSNQDEVLVRFALPESAQSMSTVGPLATCSLDTSFVGAYNAVSGEASIADVAATVDPTAFAGIGSGQQVLTFGASPELTLKSGAGWNFYYFGAFGLSSCTSGSTIVSYGEKNDQNLNADATVDLNVISASNHLQQSGATPPTAFSNVTFQWRSTGATACSSDGTVHLTLPSAVNKAITTTAGIPYNVTGTVGSVDLVLGPLPKNIDYKAEVRQTNPTTATYTFEFNTKNSAGLTNINVAVPSSASGICQTVAPATPLAPTAFTATAGSSSSISLNWTDNATNETSYKIERSPDNSTWTLINTTAVNAQSFSNTGLTPSTLYYYRLYAQNGAGDSAMVTASATTLVQTVPIAPFLNNVSGATSSTLQVNWTDNATDEDNYDVHRSTDNVTFTSVSSPTANSTSFTDTGLAASTIYYYQVRAQNGAGFSTFSSVVSGTTTSGVAPSAPLAPSILVVTPGGGSADMNWQDNSSDETGFEIERADGTCGGGGFAQVGTSPANTAVYQDFTVMMGNSYCFRVRAVNGATGSGYSNEFNYTH